MAPLATAYVFVACVAIAACTAVRGALVSSSSSSTPQVPGPWTNLQMAATDINVAEGVSADCAAAVNVT
eukprot:CAMPEP_0174851246 /NCGR_PEP_ID=MMETSP1114-20130205/22514_1 /TAXON_ID=312471 /ORGANISM="Neobodo designis, Strain CCAP 1951/1" /LENGTH=68 /DNA_ID=CAMNT_0016085769 /DNA_START=33 /DNA_END=235 /DNA_ORIENTATION=+